MFSSESKESKKPKQDLADGFVLINASNEFSAVKEKIIGIIDEYLLKTNPKENVFKKSIKYAGEKLVNSIKNIGNKNNNDQPKFHAKAGRKRAINLRNEVLKTYGNLQLVEVLLNESSNFPTATIVQCLKPSLIAILSTLGITYLPDNLKKVQEEFYLYKSENSILFGLELLKLPKDILQEGILPYLDTKDLYMFVTANKYLRKLHGAIIKKNYLGMDKPYIDEKGKYKVNSENIKKIENELKEINEYLEVIDPIEDLNSAIENKNLISSALRIKQKNFKELDVYFHKKSLHLNFFSNYEKSRDDFPCNNENNLIYLKCKEYLYKTVTDADKLLVALRDQFQYQNVSIFINPNLEIIRAMTYKIIDKLIKEFHVKFKLFDYHKDLDPIAKIYLRFLLEKSNSGINYNDVAGWSFLVEEKSYSRPRLICGNSPDKSNANSLISKLNLYLIPLLGGKSCLFDMDHDKDNDSYKAVASFFDIHEKLFGLLFADAKYRQMLITTILKPAIQAMNKNTSNNKNTKK